MIIRVVRIHIQLNEILSQEYFSGYNGILFYPGEFPFADFVNKTRLGIDILYICIYNFQIFDRALPGNCKINCNKSGSIATGYTVDQFRLLCLDLPVEILIIRNDRSAGERAGSIPAINLLMKD